MGIEIRLFPSAIITPGDQPEVHVVDIQGVQPGDFCGISINPFGGNGTQVEILKDVVEIDTQGGPTYTLRHIVTLHRVIPAVVQCNLVGLLIHNDP